MKKPPRSWPRRSWPSLPAFLDRVLKTCGPHRLPDRKVRNFSVCARLARWQGPSPLPPRWADPLPASGHSPRPAPAPPPAGALHPPGRALAFRGARTCRSTGDRPARAGETRVAFPDPARTDESAAPAAMAEAIAPATAPCCPRASRGLKPPASARPAPGGRFAPAGSGAGLCLPEPAGLQGTVPLGRGEMRVAFPVPARDGLKHLHRCNGRGHRPCHSAMLPPGQPGAKAPGQRPPRHRRALCTRRVGRWPLPVPDLPVYRAPSRTGGGNAGRVS